MLCSVAIKYPGIPVKSRYKEDYIRHTMDVLRILVPVLSLHIFKHSAALIVILNVEEKRIQGNLRSRFDAVYRKL